MKTGIGLDPPEEDSSSPPPEEASAEKVYDLSGNIQVLDTKPPARHFYLKIPFFEYAIRIWPWPGIESVDTLIAAKFLERSKTGGSKKRSLAR